MMKLMQESVSIFLYGKLSQFNMTMTPKFSLQLCVVHVLCINTAGSNEFLRHIQSHVVFVCEFLVCMFLIYT